MDKANTINNLRDKARGMFATIMSDPAKLYLVVAIVVLVIVIWLYISAQMSKK